MFKKTKKITSKKIIGFTAIVLIILFFVNGMMKFITESVARKNGSLIEKRLTVEDFSCDGMKQLEDGKWQATDNDPKMIIEEKQKITSIYFYMKSSMFPGEMTMYYTQEGDAGFSERKRIWATPVQGEENWYCIDMNMKNVTSIRIDPTMYRGNIMEFGDFIFNEETSFVDYFDISYGTVFNFIVYTGLISSVLKFLVEIITRNFD